MAVVLFAGCRAQAPVIYSIDPQIGIMGEPVTINGDFFGDTRDESYVTVAGVQPTSMSYQDWQDNKITFRIREFGEAGLIYVYVKGRKSNGMLFANQATLPSRVQGSEAGTGPRIISVTPQTGSPGALVSINGTGFGSSRGNGGVFFSWNAQMSASAPAEANIPEFAEVSENEFGYEMWADREIRVRVPDGTVAGNLEVRTSRGNSPPMAFELAGRPGTKTYGNKRSYTINYSVNIKIDEAEAPNTMYLWIPHPASSAAQRNLELQYSSVEPFIGRYRGVSLYKVDNLVSNNDVQFRLAWKVDVYSVETAVQPQSVRQEYNTPISEANLQSTPQLPADDPRVKNRAAAILGRERNPYTKALRIYEWMTGVNLVWKNYAEGDIFTVLETNQTDPYLAAMLYCTLLRSAGVPCQPVAGVLVGRNRQTMNHYWAEFWVDGFGWIPVDPAMGAGAVPSSHPNRAGYYFGNIDSQRVAFSRGFINLSPMDPRGRTVSHSRSYSLQSLREEVVGSIESYSSLWGDISITGIYVQ